MDPSQPQHNSDPMDMPETTKTPPPGPVTPREKPDHEQPATGARIPIARETESGKPGDVDDLVGKYVGPYHVQKKIARGGMGRVFLAYDEALRRPVALKVMDPGLLSDQDALKRFEREARASASVQNRHIAGIYLVGLADDGRPFMAMEYIDGGSLLHVIKNREAVPYSLIALWMEQVASALQSAYRQNVIHRDIKPANIMLTRDGEAKVVDFGLAKIFFEDSYMTQEGMVLGTPTYMAPEQGQGRAVDMRADVYSFGATFYHLISGRPPFTADSPVQIMMKHVTAPLVPMRSLNPKVPIEFDEIISRCMRKDVDERYQDYESLLSDIQRVRLQCRSHEEGSIINKGRRDGSWTAEPYSGSRLQSPPSRPQGSQPQAGSGEGHAAAGFDHRNSGYHTEEDSGRDEGLTPARIAIMAGALIVVLGGGLMAFLLGGGEEKTQGGEEGESLSAIVIRRAAEEAREQGKTPEAIQYEAFVETRQILRNLQQGLLNFELDEGRMPRDLAELATEERVIINFQVDGSGTPLDGWGVPLGYDSHRNLIWSAGLDQRHQTGDDLAVLADGDVEIPSSYDSLMNQQ